MPNEVNEATYYNYNCTGDPDVICTPFTSSSEPINIHRKSLGFIKLGLNQDLGKSASADQYQSSEGSTANNKSKKSIKVYPNPFNQSVRFEITFPIDQEKDYKIRIYNIFGQQVDVISKIITPIIDYAGLLPVGYYYFELSQDDQVITSGKMIKVKD